MSTCKLHPEFYRQQAKLDALLTRRNAVDDDFYNGIYTRWQHPVLTREMIPLSWRFDLNPETNPCFMERLGVNAVFNAGAIKLNGKYYLMARVEGNDRKSFFAVAESDSPVDGFHFWEKPVELPDTCPEETNVYDMRLTQHEDGWIYGIFCSESKDTPILGELQPERKRQPRQRGGIRQSGLPGSFPPRCGGQALPRGAVCIRRIQSRAHSVKARRYFLRQHTIPSSSGYNRGGWNPPVF